MIGVWGSWSYAPTLRHQRKVAVQLASSFSPFNPALDPSQWKASAHRSLPQSKLSGNNLHTHPAVPLPGDSKASQGDNKDSVTVFSRSDVSVSQIGSLPSSCFLDLLEVPGFFFLSFYLFIF